MKKLAIIAAITSLALPALADYQIEFLTYNGSQSNPVFDTDGATRLQSAFSGQLYTGTSAGSLTAIGSAQTFLNGGGAGFIETGAPNIPSATIGGGTTGFYQLRVWNTSAGSSFEAAATTVGAKIGSSAVTAVTFGGTPLLGGLGVIVPRTDLHSSFSLTTVAVPEPASLALGLFGAAGLLFRRRK